jgi:hypothetical protein
MANRVDRMSVHGVSGAIRELRAGHRRPSVDVVVSAIGEWTATDWWLFDREALTPDPRTGDSVIAYVVGPDLLDTPDDETDFVAAVEVFKVGKTTSSRVKTRLQQIQNGHPRRLEYKAFVNGGHYTENLLKQIARHQQVGAEKLCQRGFGEWFTGCSAETFLEVTELDDLDLCRDIYRETL